MFSNDATAEQLLDQQTNSHRCQCHKSAAVVSTRCGYAHGGRRPCEAWETWYGLTLQSVPPPQSSAPLTDFGVAGDKICWAMAQLGFQ